LLENEANIDQLIADAPKAVTLTDNRPVNEYSLLRKWFGKERKIVPPQ